MDVPARENDHKPASSLLLSGHPIVCPLVCPLQQYGFFISHGFTTPKSIGKISHFVFVMLCQEKRTHGKMARISTETSKKKAFASTTRSRIMIGAGILAVIVVADLFIAPNSTPRLDLLSWQSDASLDVKGTLQGDLQSESMVVESKTGNNKISSSQSNLVERKRMIFHHYLVGKPGIVIKDMLMCHAYAFHQNATYGGSCRGEVSPENEKKSAVSSHLLASVGLQDEVRFACPRDFPNDSTTRRSTIPREQCRKDDTAIWTPAYVDYLKSHVKYPPKVSNKFTIAVHIRRHEVTPCQRPNKGYDPYLPNSHFQTLINKYMQKDARVVIFSQNKSFEPFDEFRAKGYEIFLDDTVTDVWKTIVVSDVVILSRSSFSLIPALVAKGTVVYTPYWHAPLSHWHVVEKDVLDQSQIETERLRTSCPIKKAVEAKPIGGKKADRDKSRGKAAKGRKKRQNPN